MSGTDPVISLERFNESHLEGVAALYNETAVTRQVLQMPYQSVEVWRSRIEAGNERALKLAALHQGAVDNGPPGARLHYDPDYYAANVLDPDGYSLEFVYKKWQHVQ